MTPRLTEAPDVILYHDDCADGFGAAWAIWKRYPDAKFVPVKHGYPPPSDLDRQRVVMVDFSYPREIVEELARSTAELVILDHHVTARDTLADLPFAYFDLGKSGAVLAWEWAHGTQSPWLLRYVQDKDLWQWHLPASREINAAIASYPFDFRVWDQFQQDRLTMEGTAILRYETHLVRKFGEEAILVSFHGYTVPMIYSPVLTSQIGEQLSRDHPFCIIWHQRNGRRFFSLRSRPGGVDVASLVTRHGGGGHPNAAGFSLPLHSQQIGDLEKVLVPVEAPSASGQLVADRRKQTLR